MPANVLPVFAEQLAARIRNANKTIEEWKLKFEETPMHALTWADGVHRAVAEQSVYANALALMKQLHEAGHDGIGIEATTRDVALERCLQLSCRTNRSSSPHANLVEDHLRAAWARVAKWSEFDL